MLVETEDLIISRIEDSPFSYDDLMALIRASVQERVEQRIEFNVTRMTVEEFKSKTKNSIVLIAYTDHDLCGTACITILKDKKNNSFAYHEHIFVSPECKRKGIGTKLLKEHIEISKDYGCSYILSDTAINAKSSVKWHLKNGFKLIGLHSFSSTDYYSKVFKYQITPPILY